MNTLQLRQDERRSISCLGVLAALGLFYGIGGSVYSRFLSGAKRAAGADFRRFDSSDSAAAQTDSARRMDCFFSLYAPHLPRGLRFSISRAVFARCSIDFWIQWARKRRISCRAFPARKLPFRLRFAFYPRCWRWAVYG